MKIIRNDIGAAAVEFAVLFLLLLIIVFGIIEFGFLWLQSHYIANAAREGARVAATLEDPRSGDDLDRVENTVKEYLKGLYPSAKVDGSGGCCGNGDFIEVALTDGEAIPVSGPGTSVSTIKVTVTVQTAEIWKPVLWDLLKLFPGLPEGDIDEITEVAVFATES